MPISTIIFDFDGTIADTLPVIVRLFNSRAKEFGFDKLSTVDIETLRRMKISEIISKYGLTLIKVPYIVGKIKKELNSQIERVKLFDQMKETLYFLNKNKYNLGILSSNSKENIEKFLKSKDLELFNFIYSENNLFGKDKALINLLQKNKINPDKTIYVGDEVRDIDACKEANLKIISVSWGFNKREILEKNKPDYLIDSPEEIVKIVQG